MHTLIDKTKLIQDLWQVYDGSADNMKANEPCLLPIEEYAERHDIWHAHSKRIGVLLSTADDTDRLEQWLPDLELIAIDFPLLVDGRGFSMARTLRTRYRFEGEIRAIGAIIPDQVPMLARCGFNQFQLETAEHAQTALRLLQIPLPNYQSSADGRSEIALPGAARNAAIAKTQVVDATGVRA